MGIDGLILLDSTGRPIVQSGFRATPPTYPLLHVDAFNNALQKASRPSDVDPVIYVPPVNMAESPSACCHVPVADIRFLCPIRGNLDPLFAFAFLQTFVDILQEYFGSLSAAILKENFDVVYQLLEETLDSGGYPLTTSPSVLREIVLPPSLLTKLLNVAGPNFTATFNSATGMGSTGSALSSPIPWRKQGIKYAANEIYFDIIEDLHAIINKQGVAISGNVYGKIEANARVSGTPDITLSFANSNIMTECAFHPCVRLPRWKRDQILSFVPPDGKFTLAEYRYSPAAASASARIGSSGTASSGLAANGSLAKDSVAIPFGLKTQIDVQESTVAFDITFTSRLTTRPFENVVVEFDMGEGASGIKCLAGRETGGLGSRGGIGPMDLGSMGSMIPGASSGASWAVDSRKRILKWEIPSAAPSTSWNLRGSFSTPSKTPRPAHALQIRFEIGSQTFSSLKVEQVKITVENYKPFKGVRGKSVGNVEWRW